MSDTYECPNCHGRHPYGTICVGPVSDDAAVVQTGLDLAAARAESAQLRADLDEARGALRNMAATASKVLTLRGWAIQSEDGSAELERMILAAQPAAGTTAHDIDCGVRDSATGGQCWCNEQPAAASAEPARTPDQGELAATTRPTLHDAEPAAGKVAGAWDVAAHNCTATRHCECCGHVIAVVRQAVGRIEFNWTAQNGNGGNADTMPAAQSAADAALVAAGWVLRGGGK
jgi:hypothetical protein